MAFDFLSETTRDVAVIALFVATGVGTVFGGGTASAQPRREVGSYRCSVHAEIPASSSGEAKTNADEPGRARGQSAAKGHTTPDGAARFSVREALNLELRTRVRSSSPGSSRIYLRLYTPKGHLYQELPVTLVEEREPKSSNGRRPMIAEATLPVAGTAIVTNSLYGEWEVLAYVEGSQKPCSPPHHFVLDP